MMKGNYLALGVTLAVLTACNQASEAPTSAQASVDADAVLAEIHGVEQSQVAAFEAKDVAGAASIYAADAQILAPGTGLLSGDARTKMFEDMLADPAFKLAPNEGSNLSWIAASGDLAATTFTAAYTYTDTTSGEVKTVPMANQTVWQKSAEGKWQIVSDFNVVMPEAPAA